MTDYREVKLLDGLTLMVPTSLPTKSRAVELGAAWKRVVPASHWKASVDTVITATLEELATILEAIEFYTATEGTATKLGDNLYWVKAPGYWAGPAN